MRIFEFGESSIQLRGGLYDVRVAGLGVFGLPV